MAHDGPTTVVILEEDEVYNKFSFKKLLQFTGPGILMSIAYVDPGNLESDLQVGAQAGYVLLWLLLVSTAMGFIVQMQAAKLGVVTGKHLAEHCREQYPPVPRYALWVMAEIAIIGSDIQEVIGSAIALALLSGGWIPLWAGVLLTAVDSFALLFIERLGIRILEGFFGLLIGVMVIAFGIMYSQANVPTSEVISGFVVPRLPRKDIPVAVALMGSLIMPHNIYLHSALVKTRKLGTDSRAAKREALGYFAIESAFSLAVAVVINLFITAVFAAGFYGRGLTDIGLQSAGRYLGETYHQAVVYIWALGLLAAGQSSTMTGTYTGQFVMSGYLDLKISPWARVAVTRAVAIVPTLMVALAFRNSGSELDVLNQALNLLQSIQLPFALIPVLTFASSKRLMGDFANSALLAMGAWSVAVLVVLINLTAVYEMAYEAVVADPWVTGSALAAVVLLYFLFVGYLLLGPQSVVRTWLGGCSCCCQAGICGGSGGRGSAAAGTGGSAGSSCRCCGCGGRGSSSPTMCGCASAVATDGSADARCCGCDKAQAPCSVCCQANGKNATVVRVEPPRQERVDIKSDLEVPLLTSSRDDGSGSS